MRPRLVTATIASARLTPLPWAALSLFLALAPASAAPATANSNDPEFSEVMQLLKSRYADPSAVADSQIGNAALNGVLTRLGGGATIMMQPSLTATSRPIFTQLLFNGKIGYVRMATFKPPRDWNQLENQLFDWQKTGVVGVILDVRDFEAANDYAEAARAASIFVRAGEPLFIVQGLQIPQVVYRSTGTVSKRQIDLPLVVLTNHRTIGAAEAFTAILRKDARAILVGRSTAGQAALFSEFKLSSGRYLRLATGQALLADGSPLFGKPVIPDISLYIDDQKERLAIEEANSGNAVKTTQEIPLRARTSEAALVREETPELDELLSEQTAARQGNANDEGPLQDVALIRAMDVLRSIQFAQAQLLPRDILTSKK